MANASSRFRRTKTIEYDGENRYGLWTIPTSLKNASYHLHVVQSGQEGKPDYLAYGFYGSIDYFWVLLAFNDVTDIGWPRVGQTIKIPDPAIVLTEL